MLRCGHRRTAIAWPLERADTQAGTSRSGVWPWLLGVGLLAIVVAGAIHFSEEQAFVRIASRAEPWWLVLACIFQAATYIAQGGIWNRVTSSCGYSLSRRTAYRLSLAKLFVDQALPSAGLSSSVLIAKALAHRGLPTGAVNAAVLINIASYHLAYALALAAALVIVVTRDQGNALILVTSALFLGFSAALSAVVLLLAGRPDDTKIGRLQRLPVIRSLAGFLAAADPALVRNRRLLAGTTFFQGIIVVLDAATIWILTAALGEPASVSGVFASFMIASLFRTMSVVPGGLGTFEVTSTLTLRMAGLDVATAVSATLLFRVLSFWIPMLPGYWASRQVALAEAVPGGPQHPQRD